MKHARANIGTASARRALPELAPAVPPVETTDPIVAREIRPVRKTSKPPSTEDLGNIKTTAMSFRNMHEHGDLLLKYMEARKKIFIDRLKWHVPQNDGLEFDQYDTPFCHWVVLHEFGEVIGGVRLVPTNAKCGIYTYMLRDAQAGILPDLPTDVLFFKAPVEVGIWEASRFFISETVPAKRRRVVQSMLFGAMNDVAKENGALFILGIVPYVWARWARRLDVSATPIGAKFDIEGTQSQSVLFNTSSLNS
ncbi:acyl-homoserine-lactone synthase [Roseovarius rhodophyticola]|uniref:Acyl-homoserine-lactone synthase n=1 Tax=Roseovarius rhodophyticola TaxID=3080827 RepID=A0ABZ2TCJ5_9RHOB|nr:acyl-homoserine-lactone synthase [Roseovarius sp. W115]MDV2931159.1 acyl-homoserine-lactone synthase [Roseovarius sp. W115]